MNELQLLLIVLLLVCTAVIIATLARLVARRTLVTSLALLLLGGGVTLASNRLVGVGAGVLIAAVGSIFLWRSNKHTWPSILLETPILALGPPTLAAYVFVDYATATQQRWSSATISAVLWLGLALMGIAVVGAATATRLSSALRWQTAAQWALLPIVFGTGQPAAGPIAAGLLAHLIVTTTALGLSLGLLQHIAHDDQIATARPAVPVPRAAIAYALAAASSAGFPPLLGYALRRVVILLALPLPWLVPLLFALSTLLALSYIPALIVFWRPTATERAAADRNGLWSLLLMLALVIAGAVPDLVWQWILGDPAVTEPQPPPIGALVQTVLVGVLVGVLVLLAWRALRDWERSSRNTSDVWELPFAALRAVLRPLDRRR